MTVTVLKSTFKKIPPKLLQYRNYDKFCNEEFVSLLLNKNALESDLESFIDVTIGVLNSLVPLKKKIIRGNQQPFMNKILNKAVMYRSSLRSKFLKDRSEINKAAYNKQRNYCVNLFRRQKKRYFEDLDPKNITDNNKRFWKTIKPLLSDKQTSSENIILLEGNNLITEDQKVAETLNNFFIKAVPNLNLEINKTFLSCTEGISDPILKVIKMYEKHPSIILIKEHVTKSDKFSFSKVTVNDAEKELTLLDTGKSCLKSDIPTKVLKDNINLFSTILSNSFNESQETGYFPDKFKMADITPVFKKGVRTSVSNYRPISILSNLSKVFERFMHKQISEYFERFLSKFQCGFRKNHSAQNCLVYMLEKFKEALDKKKNFGALLTDLSKAFDCISHDLLIAKLHAYGFDYKSLNLIYNYLHNRKQRVKIGDSFSIWAQILYGVPQGSILGPLLFNIFICDLFFVLCDSELANYADDSTPFTVSDTVHSVVAKNKDMSEKFFTWLETNAMKGNADKCHLLLSSNQQISVTIKDSEIISSNHEKLLGITIDNDLNFNKHVTNLCKKANSKISALARVSPYMTINKARMVMKAFVSSQFSYCPLVWMNHSRTLNSRINRLHERSLRIVYKDKNSSFQQLLIKDNSVTIHHRNIQYLSIELYKVKNGLSPPIMNLVFPTIQPVYNLRSNNCFKGYNVRTVHYGTESLRYLGPKIWSLIPNEIRCLSSLQKFKSKIKKWIPEACPCRLCKVYIKDLGFL